MWLLQLSVSNGLCVPLSIVNLSCFLLFISGDVTPQSLDPEVLLKVKSEIEEEL